MARGDPRSQTTCNSLLLGGLRGGRVGRAQTAALGQIGVSETPGRRPRREASPAGSSSTERALRHEVRRQGPIVEATLSTRSERSRKTTSIAKRMKAVWIE